MATQGLWDEGYGHTGAGGQRVWPHSGWWAKGVATQLVRPEASFQNLSDKTQTRTLQKPWYPQGGLDLATSWNHCWQRAFTSRARQAKVERMPAALNKMVCRGFDTAGPKSDTLLRSLLTWTLFWDTLQNACRDFLGDI